MMMRCCRPGPLEHGDAQVVAQADPPGHRVGKLSVDVGFWGGAVPSNIDQMAPLWDKGVFGFKCFTAHSSIDEYGYLGYEGVKEVLAELAELDAVLIVHAEDSRILAEAPQDITNPVTIVFFYPMQCYVGLHCMGSNHSYHAIERALANVLQIGRAHV